MNIDNNLKDDYWDLTKRLDLEEKFNPINLNEEKEKFKEKLYNGENYNPIFEYPELNSETKNTLKSLHMMLKSFENSKSVTSKYYARKIILDISCLNNFIKRQEKDPSYSKWLTSLYGIPSNELLRSAIEIITKTKKSGKDIPKVPSEEVLSIFSKELDSRNFTEWRICLKSIPAKISINPVSRVITIKDASLFSEKEIKRLIAHEIDVHVLRNENGKLQNDKIFSYGFPDYLKTEEGLAITSEYRQNLLENNDLRKYCSRVIASYYTDKQSFYDLFVKIKSYHSFEQAYSVVSRVKRGLTDTSQFSGYTKDQVYLAGYLELKSENSTTLKKLFCGKIGLKDINFISKQELINTNYPVPNWLKKP